MIENFNFYDVYGYFLPGFVLLALLWLPFGLFTGLWPQAELSSALVAVVFGYIAGHILQTIAQNTIPSKAKDDTGTRRHPSDIILDTADTSFSTDFRAKLVLRIKTMFDIDVVDGDLTKQSRQRQDAFLLCRNVLIKSKSISYAEQFEGLYALMRGVAGAFAAGLVYHLGWAVSGLMAPNLLKLISVLIALFLLLTIVLMLLKCQPIIRKVGKGKLASIIVFLIVIVVAAYFWRSALKSWVWVGLAIGLIFGSITTMLVPDWELPPDSEVSQKTKARLAWMKVAPLIFTLFMLGYSSGFGTITTVDQRGFLVIIVLADLLIVLKCLMAYRHFAKEFALSIYRSFYLAEKSDDP